MIGFEYKFNKPTEILNNIKLLLDFSIFEYIIIGIIFVVFIICGYYLFPYINILGSYIYKQREKKKRKKFINSIAVQKDIEDEIEKELNLK